MPKIIYANIIWFLIVVGAAVNASLTRHSSEFWNEMPDVRLSYDVLFVLVFSATCIVSIIGMLQRKAWGYKSAIGFNYALASIVFIPFLGLVIFNFSNEITLSELSEVSWGITLENIVLSVTSLLFTILMSRQHVKSVFS